MYRAQTRATQNNLALGGLDVFSLIVGLKRLLRLQALRQSTAKHPQLNQLQSMRCKLHYQTWSCFLYVRLFSQYNVSRINHRSIMFIFCLPLSTFLFLRLEQMAEAEHDCGAHKSCMKLCVFCRAVNTSSWCEDAAKQMSQYKPHFPNSWIRMGLFKMASRRSK